MSEENMDEKELREKVAEFNSLNRKLTIRTLQLKDRAELLNRKESEYVQKNAKFEERAAAFSQKKEELEKSFQIRELSLREREEGILKQEQELELSLKKKAMELKTAQEAELVQERIKAMETVQEQLAKQRMEFEDTIAQYGLERRQEAEQQAEKIRSDAAGESEQKAEKIKAEAEAEAAARLEKAETEARNRLEKAEAEAENRLEKAETEARNRLEKAETEAENRLEKAEAEAGKRLEEAARLEEENARRKKELDEREEDLAEREAELDFESRKNETEKRKLQLKQKELESQERDLENTVMRTMADKSANFKVQMEAKDQALQEMREKVKYLMEEQDAVEKFKAGVGKDPAIIENEIRNLQRTIQELKEELANSVPAEVQKERNIFKRECEDYRIQIAELEKENRIYAKKNIELAELETMNIGLETRNEEMASLIEELRSQNDTYKQRIDRMCSAKEKLADREQRIAEIRKGILPPMTGAGLTQELSETAWLETIYQQCDAFGIHFPRRILYAFHTALKIADWSSVTVLAGISGTGKSELPKLYAAFGGFHFISVPVQPYWDSQESMLGYFNSIDNRFEPEPLLRFLVQCTEDEEYSRYMSIVLLDEMNLAYAQQYFAEFLSKLETRRDMPDDMVPSVEIKLGAGVEPYQLRLERSVLWTGTVNREETAKLLSDKVLDRGLVIQFPRPGKLRSRKTMGNLARAVKESERPMLSRKKWESWIVREAILQGDQEKEMQRYRLAAEEISREMEPAGRALGHRIWQSMEYYILNYPPAAEEMRKLAPGEMSAALRQSMKTAFEDQIVQKIMPKLSGVETRGKGKESLDNIRILLEEKGFERLKDDFETACEQGDGQFIWSSAKYMEADEEPERS